MSDQPDLFPETVKRPRGRPKKPNALTGAERMRRLREKAATVLYAPEAERDGQALADLSDTALCELVREPLRAGWPFALAEIAVELVRRANERQADTHPDREPIRLARWVTGAGWIEWRDSRTVTKNTEIPTGHVDMDNGHVTKNEVTVDQGEAFPLAPIPLELAMPVESKPCQSSASNVEPVDQGEAVAKSVETVKSKPSASKGSREYPPDVRAKAVRMKDQKKPYPEILDMIASECGRKPRRSEIGRQIEGWREDSRVVAILENP